MPANYDNDWTADDQFWNEAWADMDQRLDRDKRRGGPWPWLLALLLLLGGGITGWYMNGAGTQVPASPENTPSVTATDTAVYAGAERPSRWRTPTSDEMLADAKITAPSANSPLAAGVPATPAAPIPPRSATTPRWRTPTSDEILSDTENPVPPVNFPITAIPRSNYAPTTPTPATAPLPTIDYQLLTTPLPFPSPEISHQPQFSHPVTTPAPEPAYTFSTYATFSASTPRPGAGIALTRRQPLGKRWSVPIALGISREFTAPPNLLRDTEEEFTQPDLALDLFANATSGAVLGLTDLRADWLRLETGLDRRIGKRFSAGLRVSADYLLGARLNGVGRIESVTATPIPGEQYVVNYRLNDISGFNNADFVSNGSVTIDNTLLAVHRLNFTTGLRLGYELTTHLRAELGVDYRLRPIHENGEPAYERTRLRAGLGWEF